MSISETFLLKADIAVPDEILHTLSVRRQEQAVDSKIKIYHISQKLFGKLPDGYEVLFDGGTFCFIYKLRFGHKNILLKLALDLPNYITPGFSKQLALHQCLSKHRIPVPLVYAPETPSDSKHYLVMDFIEGNTYGQFSNTQPQFDTVVESLGVLLASVHQIKAWKYGEPVPELFEDAVLKGAVTDWQCVILTRLEEHLFFCKQKEYLSNADFRSSLSVFQELSEQFKLPKSSLLHGDLGPKNIIIKSDGGLCLLDWEDALIGDPLFDIAMWGSFVQNKGKLNHFMRGYFQGVEIPKDFHLRYCLYYYRILLAKTMHRYRFQYHKNDQIPPAGRLLEAWLQLKEAVNS
ncbi:MAG: phosphotransferase [Legionella sp.]|nr:phosphotransferase [Legionella sp.]